MLLALVFAVTPEEARRVCEAAGRTDCDEVASWFEPLPPATEGARLQEECAADNAKSCFQLGVLRKQGELPGEHLPLYQKACTLELDKACQDLWVLGGGADPGWIDRKVTAGKAGCEAGERFACADGALYATAFQHPDGHDMMRRACELGDSASCYSASVLWTYSDDKDELRRGLELLNQACAMGNVNAKADVRDLKDQYRNAGMEPPKSCP